MLLNKKDGINISMSFVVVPSQSEWANGTRKRERVRAPHRTCSTHTRANMLVLVSNKQTRTHIFYRQNTNGFGDDRLQIVLKNIWRLLNIFYIAYALCRVLLIDSYVVGTRQQRTQYWLNIQSHSHELNDKFVLCLLFDWLASIERNVRMCVCNIRFLYTK